MAIFRSIKSLTQISISRKPILNLSTIIEPTSQILSTTHPASAFKTHNSLLSPLSKWVAPFRGPLFLSSTPFQLSQFATPFYFQSDVVFLPKIRALVSQEFSVVKLGIKRVVSGDPDSGTEVRVEKGLSGGVVDGFVNLPNLISMGRLISGPVIGWMILQEMYLPAFCGLAVSGATDWLDGYAARKLGINSVVGSYLDPLADKVLIGCVALAMVEKGLLNSGLVGIIVLRDVALIGGAVYNRASSLNWNWKNWSDFLNLDGIHAQKVEPLFLSKVNTVFQLVLVTAALLQPDFGTQDTESYITYLSWLVASTTVASTAAYGAQHFRRKHLLRKSL